MKTVNFLGQDWDVPEWAEWITQDSNGPVWVWEDEPSLCDGAWLPMDENSKMLWIAIDIPEAKIEKI